MRARGRSRSACGRGERAKRVEPQRAGVGPRAHLREGAPIHNPKLFDMFVEIYSDGTELELDQLVKSEKKADDLCFAIRRRRARRGFKEDLEAVKEHINSLYVDDFQGTEGEKTLIRRIRDLVEKRLVPLIAADDL